jgi:hypothetical protein
MERSSDHLVQKMSSPSPLKMFLVVLIIALISGVSTGYVLARTSSKNGGGPLTSVTPGGNGPPKSAGQDNQTFSDFAEGVIQPKPSPSAGDDYTEGAYLLQRDGAVPVALTSSVVDLSKYVGKKVKVYGETQKALKTGWLMDVGKVETE